jgi:hypothetical protein
MKTNYGDSAEDSGRLPVPVIDPRNQKNVQFFFVAKCKLLNKRNRL